VNNAGVFRFTPFTELDEKYFDWMMKINVLGPVLMTKAALPHFSKSGSSVVNLSSVLSQSFIPGMALYSASKAAINSLTGALAFLASDAASWLTGEIVRSSGGMR
jgi:3-oxoacyl-[acyl-carrier protein] reductase